MTEWIIEKVRGQQVIIKRWMDEEEKDIVPPRTETR